MSSALGKQLGLTSESSAEEIVSALGNVKDWSSTKQNCTSSTSDQFVSCCRMNGNNLEIIPARGLWNSWSFSKSCISLVINNISLMNLNNPSVSIQYLWLTGQSRTATCPSGAKVCIAVFCVYRTSVSGSAYATSISISGSKKTTWFNNSQSNRSGWALLNAGGCVVVNAGKDNSNTWVSGSVALIYQ